PSWNDAPPPVRFSHQGPVARRSKRHNSRDSFPLGRLSRTSSILPGFFFVGPCSVSVRRSKTGPNAARAATGHGRTPPQAAHADWGDGVGNPTRCWGPAGAVSRRGPGPPRWIRPPFWFRVGPIRAEAPRGGGTSLPAGSEPSRGGPPDAMSRTRMILGLL